MPCAAAGGLLEHHRQVCLDHHRNQSGLGAPRCLDNHRHMPCAAAGSLLEHHRQVARTPSASGSITIGTTRALVRPGASTTLGLCFLLLLAGSWLAHHRNQSSLGAPRWLDNHRLMPCVAAGGWLAHHRNQSSLGAPRCLDQPRQLARSPSEPVGRWYAQVPCAAAGSLLEHHRQVARTLSATDSHTIGKWLDHHRNQSGLGALRCLGNHRLIARTPSATCSHTMGDWLAHHRNQPRDWPGAGARTPQAGWPWCAHHARAVNGFRHIFIFLPCQIHFFDL